MTPPTRTRNVPMPFSTTTPVRNNPPRYWAIKDNRTTRSIPFRKAHLNLQKHDHPPEINQPHALPQDLMTKRMKKRTFHQAARLNGKVTLTQT